MRLRYLKHFFIIILSCSAFALLAGCHMNEWKMENDGTKLAFKNYTYQLKSYIPSFDPDNLGEKIGETDDFKYDIYRIKGWDEKAWVAAFERGWQRMGDIPSVYYNGNADATPLKDFDANKIEITDLKNVKMIASVTDTALIAKIINVVSDQNNYKHYGVSGYEVGTINTKLINIYSNKYKTDKQYFLIITQSGKYYIEDNDDTEAFCDVGDLFKPFLQYNQNG